LTAKLIAALVTCAATVGCANVAHPPVTPTPTLPPLTRSSGQTVLLQESGHGSATLRLAIPGTSGSVQFSWDCTSSVTGARVSLEVAGHSYVSSGCVEQPAQAPTFGATVPLSVVNSPTWELVANPATTWRVTAAVSTLKTSPPL
jgi:hypothetical protein